MIDIALPIGIAVGVMYIIVVLSAWFIPAKKAVLQLAVLSSILIVVGFFLSPHDGAGVWKVYANRAFSLIAIWVTALLLDNIKQKSKILEAVNVHLDREVAKQTKQLTARNRELEQFVYIASHDLQEPLRTVNSFTEFLSSNYGEAFDEKGKKSMRFMTEAVTRMQVLIHDLLEYARIGTDVQLSNVDCAQLMHNLKADLASHLTDTNTTLIIGSLPKVQVYETEFRLLIQNLISNAIKFRKEQVPPHIEISAKIKNGDWLFSVSDNGIGITKKYQERIFSIFQRLHPKSEYEGSGIGLAHCHKIVALHGGEIWVESQQDVGSTFYFTIPK